MKSYWKEIEQMGWGRTSHNYEALSREYHAKWGKRKMQAVRRFVDKQVRAFYTRIKEWEKEHDRVLAIYSDDGLNDVTYHIVGLGKKAFKAAMDNPVLVERRYYSRYGYTESFAYAFHDPENYTPKTKPVPVAKPSKSGVHMFMLQRFADKFAGESKAAVIDRLMEYYSNMPFMDLVALYKEKFPN